jgi:effector-binding domain-containing protein
MDTLTSHSSDLGAQIRRGGFDVLQVRFHREEATAVRRAFLVPEQLPDWIPAACAVVAEHLRHDGIAPNGFPFARWHSSPDGVIEVEAGFPVTAPIAGTGLIEPSTLPAGPVLAVWHTDPDQKLSDTYQLIDEWLETANATRTGDSWEVYHDLPACDQLGTRIELVRPITFADSSHHSK